MKTWRIGIVGAGAAAEMHARAVAALPNTRVAGFCDSGSGRAAALAGKYGGKVFRGFEDMARSEETDLLSVTTPSGRHLEPTLAAAAAGKHVLCEKPLEVTLERADAMIEAHRRAGTRLGGVFQCRFAEPVRHLAEAVGSGRFGTITFAGVFVPWWRSAAYYRDSWRGTRALDGGGAIMNQSIHAVDLLVKLLPPVETVQACTTRLGHPAIEVEDTACALLRFRGGALGTMYGSTAAWPGRARRIEVTGTRGTVVLEDERVTAWRFEEEQPLDGEIRRRFAATPGAVGGAADPAVVSHACFRRNVEAFLQAVERNESFELDAPEARKALALVLAVYASAERDGAPVSPFIS